VLGLSCACACSKQKSPQQAGAGGATATAFATATAGSVARTVQVKQGCRALVVTGRATVNGLPIGVSTLLDGEHWLELDAGASVALRHTLTSREFKLIGPTLVLPCRGGSEQLLLAKGQLSTSANLGVRPGAEVLIATAFGTVRYGDAALDVEFGRAGLSVRVKQGEAWVEPEDRGQPRFKNPVGSGSTVHLATQPLSAAQLAAACQTSALTAAEAARRVLDTGSADAGGSLGARAALHLRDRSQARAACAIAATAAYTTSDPAERQRLSASVAHSDGLWQSIPRAASSQKD
jgi:hypothetical protein